MEWKGIIRIGSQLAGVGTAIIAILSVTAAVTGQTPLGSEFQVNTYTTNNQYKPSVAADGQGRFTVVWHSVGSPDTDDSSLSILGRRYDADGGPLGDDFQVNSYTTLAQYQAQIAMGPGGQFVVVWQGTGPGTDSSLTGLFARQFDSEASPLGDDFQVNTYTTSNQKNARVGTDSESNFVVVWQSLGSSDTDSDAWSVQGQRFGSDGDTLGPEFQVNTYTTSSQSYPDIAMSPAGDFVVVWASKGSFENDSDSYSIQARRYDSGGNPLSIEFQINSFTTSGQLFPTVSLDQSGGFPVTWQSGASPGDDNQATSVIARNFDSNASGTTLDFQVNTYINSFQVNPVVATEPSGDFIVVWGSGQDGSGASVHAQRLGSTGQPLGGEFQVNTYTTSSQTYPDVAVTPEGEFVFVWHSLGSSGTDTSLFSIQGQRYESMFIFEDDFESGDTFSWSATVP